MASSTHKRLRPDSDDDELNAQQFSSHQNANVARFLIVKSERKKEGFQICLLLQLKRAFKQLQAILRVSKV